MGILLIALAVVLVAVLVALFLIFYDVTEDSFYEKLYKGPKNFPIFGHVFRMRTDDLAQLTKQHKDDVKKYGSPVRYKFIREYMLHISKPEHFEAICKHTTNLAKPVFYDVVLAWLGQGLLTSDGDKWRTRRKMLTPAFHFQILREFLPIFNEHAYEMTEFVRRKAKENKPFDVCPMISMSTLDIICETAMGRRLNALQSMEDGTTSPYVTAIIEFGEYAMRRLYGSWLFVNDNIYWLLSKDGRETKKCLDIMHKFTNDTIAQREKDGRIIDGQSTKKRLAFLDLLLEMKREGKLTAKDVQEETDTFMFEGHDTTSAAIMWCIFCFGHFLEYQKQCQDEIDRVMTDGSDLSADQISELNLLDRCIKESQRMFPSVPMVARKVDHRMELEDGKVVNPGATVQFNFVALHRNPDHWPEPNRFDPDRFLPENVKNRHPFAFCPFSAGARNCIGQKFAVMELKVIMAFLLKHFSWTSVDAIDSMHGAMLMVLRPENGIWVNMKPRQ